MRLHHLPGRVAKDFSIPFAIVDDESFCLIASGSVRSANKGHTTTTLQKAVRKGMIEAKPFRVQGLCGSSARTMVRVVVLHEGKEIAVLADIVTGSLFSIETGECYTGNLWIKGYR